MFLQIVLVGFVFQSLGMGMNNFLRTAGRPNLSLGTSVLGTVACLVLNAMLVLGMGWALQAALWPPSSGRASACCPSCAS